MSQSTTAGHSSLATVNPYTDELVREFPAMEEAAIDQPVEAADQAFAGWRAKPHWRSVRRGCPTPPG